MQYTHNKIDNFMKKKKNRKKKKKKQKKEREEGESQPRKHPTCRTYALLGSSCCP